MMLKKKRKDSKSVLLYWLSAQFSVAVKVKDLRNSGCLHSKTRVSASQVRRHLFRCLDNLFRLQSAGSGDTRRTWQGTVLQPIHCCASQRASSSSWLCLASFYCRDQQRSYILDNLRIIGLEFPDNTQRFPTILQDCGGLLESTTTVRVWRQGDIMHMSPVNQLNPLGMTPRPV